LDILVNNAGVYRPATLRDTDQPLWDLHYRVNQLGVFLGMRSVVDGMVASGGGSIVNVSSNAGMKNVGGMFAYATSKWAVRGMSKLAATELAPSKIRVNSVHPGLIDTPMLGANDAERMRMFEAMIPLLEKRLEIRQYLIDRDLGSKITYLTELQDLVGQRHDLLVHRSRYQEADAAVAALREARTKTVAEHRRGVFDELAKAEQKVASLSEDVVKAQQRTKLQRLTAPVDGVVQQLAVHTVGGVVTPGQALLVIVPINSHLEIEAMVSNRDIGFVHAGDEAEIKVDTFNFTRYGLLHGKVMSLSRDAVVRDKPQDKTGDKVQGAETGTSEPKGQELVYTARISLDRAQMKIEDNLVNLSPGMALTVEIKTGSRTVIGYLLSPLLRYSHDSLRER